MSATKHEANNNKSKKQENTLKEISKEIYDKKKVKVSSGIIYILDLKIFSNDYRAYPNKIRLRIFNN